MNNQSIHIEEVLKSARCHLLSLLSLLALSPQLHCPFPFVVLLSYCCWQLPLICSLARSVHLHLTLCLLPLNPRPLRCPLTLHALLCPLMLPTISSRCFLPPYTALCPIILHSTPLHCPLSSHNALISLTLSSTLSWCSSSLPHSSYSYPSLSTTPLPSLLACLLYPSCCLLFPLLLPSLLFPLSMSVANE